MQTSFHVDHHNLFSIEYFALCQFGEVPKACYSVDFMVKTKALLAMPGSVQLYQYMRLNRLGKSVLNALVLADDSPNNNWMIQAYVDNPNHPEYMSVRVLAKESYAGAVGTEQLTDYLYKNRVVFRKKRESHIRLLINTPTGLTVRDCPLHTPTVDVARHYNDDLCPVLARITRTLDQSSSSGLVLLDGQPGTGKTTLVKWLTGQFGNRPFVFIPSGSVEALSSPSLIPLLLEMPGSVLFVEDAERCLRSRQHGGDPSVVSTLLQLTDGVLGDALQLMVIATCNAPLTEIDPALLRAGRLIGQYTFSALEAPKADAIRRELGKVPTSESATLADLYADAPIKNGVTKKQAIGFRSEKIALPATPQLELTNGTRQ